MCEIERYSCLVKAFQTKASFFHVYSTYLNNLDASRDTQTHTEREREREREREERGRGREGVCVREGERFYYLTLKNDKW
jgi:hypothetical protein